MILCPWLGEATQQPCVVLASASGVVSVVCGAGFHRSTSASGLQEGERRPRLVYSKSIDSFVAAKQELSAAGVGVKWPNAVNPFSVAAEAWRTQVELATAPPFELLDNFRIPGLPQHAALDDPSGEWEAV
jgi:hypothetical protein